LHLEILVEDSSGAKLLSVLIPKILGEQTPFHTWRLHSYKGIGRIPAGLVPGSDPNKRILLDQLPRILRGYANTPGIDAVVVVLDTDKRNCVAFLSELNSMAEECCSSGLKIVFRLAIEEMEAWYFGDRTALLRAYPRAKQQVLNAYEQDSQCDTWESLADAIYPGGSPAIKMAGWPLPGQVKHEWAEKIAPFMKPDRNESTSFNKFRNGLQLLVAKKK